MKRMVLALCAALVVIGPAAAQTGQPGAQDGPPLAPGKPGETLSETLDRTEGVIKPPPTDPKMQVTPPRTDSNMPVVPPSATGQKPADEPGQAK